TFCLLFVDLFLYSSLTSEIFGQELSVYFFPVGQGDSELIKTKRHAVLIDTGPGTKVVSELDKLIPVYKRKIDLILITHPNVDHFGGMQEILKHYEVKVVMMNGIDTESGSYKNMVNVIKQNKIPIVFARSGQKIEFSEAKLSIIWPGLDLKIHETLPDKKLNDTSIVSSLEFKDFSALFTGDISANAERVLAGILPDIDLLKVAHHGSKYSSSEKFLATLHPEYAVIEVGKNSYGHPTPEALLRLSGVGAEILRTDVNGLVKVLWKNNEWQIADNK
ncbi:MAG: internalization-related competence protein ComEC/Rec2 protein, partial [Parcubacteria group bacterium GW2011_GWB1_41_4]